MNGLRIVVDFAKYVIPSVLLIKILEYSGWLYDIARWAGPFMKFLGLPGEASLPLLLSNISIYSAIAALLTMSLTGKQITIICAMITMFHAMVMESVIVGKGGGNSFLVFWIRFAAALLTGWVLNLLL